MARAEATAADVAARAGVSRTAVSFVLNGKASGNIAPATRDRILAVATELGYTPHPVARSLRTRRTQVLGVVTNAVASSPFAGRILSGATDRAHARGYLLTVFDSQNRPELEQQGAEELHRRRVDGLLYASMGLEEVESVPDVGLPIALANCYRPDDRSPAAIPDEVRAGRAAAEHLVSLGHRDIAMIVGSANLAGPLRLKGFRAALAKAGVKPVVQRVKADWTIDVGYAATRRIIDQHPQITAIFCVTDRIATGSLLAAAHQGLSVPEDLSIMGFDDQEQLAANLVPALTTMALPHQEMGQTAVDLLLDEIEGVEFSGPRRRLLEVPLVVRDSVAPPQRR
ncbi:LacI family DNA-binding transcriptional regulator [Demetria terragena]|uniref:LacI family DNA-binding transcriptional regulator n=1 Tax=Demetria terragena TaxID=63959 RepID=UPI0003757BE9|nr:LacI family DNA-binding transcriptional regulator [Demetria terragena]